MQVNFQLTDTEPCSPTLSKKLEGPFKILASIDITYDPKWLSRRTFGGEDVGEDNRVAAAIDTAVNSFTTHLSGLAEIPSEVILTTMLDEAVLQFSPPLAETLPQTQVPTD
jgi:hypothetical protein